MRAELLIRRTLDMTPAVFERWMRGGAIQYVCTVPSRAFKAVPRFAQGRGRRSTRIGLARSSRDTVYPLVVRGCRCTTAAYDGRGRGGW